VQAAGQCCKLYPLAGVLVLQVCGLVGPTQLTLMASAWCTGQLALMVPCSGGSLARTCRQQAAGGTMLSVLLLLMISASLLPLHAGAMAGMLAH
jgi:hypothetical protein